MFSYYGGKTKLAKLYPHPQYQTIIEPFAGSARYSLHGDNWKKNVRLYDLDEYVCGVWSYLIRVGADEIRSLPDIAGGQHVDEFKLTQEQRWLVGFGIQQGVNAPRKTASKVGRFNSWNTDRERIADNLYKIRHWTITKASYASIDNRLATWFIDPPYQDKGSYYRKSSKAIDFSHLGRWSMSRFGQIVLCENQGATWAPFRPLTTITGANHKKSAEVYFTR